MASGTPGAGGCTSSLMAVRWTITISIANIVEGFYMNFLMATPLKMSSITDPTRMGAKVDKWTLRFLSMAQSVARWSKDPSTRVGAVLVSPDRRIVIPGYNGLPRGIEDSTDRLLNREWKLRTILHAEHNAILTARQDVSGWTMYVTHHPCSNCAAVMVQSGIGAVHYIRDNAFEDKWRCSLETAGILFKEAGVHVEGHRLWMG